MNIVNQNTGLQFHLVKNEFQQQIQRSEHRYNNYSEIAGFVAGLISAIAILYTGIYVLNNKVVWITNDQGRRILSPGHAKFELFGIFSISCGWLIGGFAIGGAVYGLCYLWGFYKVSQLKLFITDLDNNYGNNGLLTNQDIEILLNKKAQAIHSDALEKHCCQHAKAQVIGLLASPAARSEETHFWFKSCQDILGGVDSDDYKDFRVLLEGKLCVQNVRPLYELALQTKDVRLQQSCVHFCGNNAQALKNHAVWQLGETPEEISEVLYA